MSGKPEYTFLDRELSWLSFNGRVLQEAANPNVPLGERLNFLGIFSSNLDEFFRVRVASLRSLLRLKPKRVSELGISPEQTLRDIHAMVSAQQNQFGELFQGSIVPGLARYGIRLVTGQELSPAQAETAGLWFDQQVMPLLQIVMLDGDGPVPFLRNRAVYLVVELWAAEGRHLAGEIPDYALVNVPSPPLPRFITLDTQDGRHTAIFLDDVIRSNLRKLFPNHETGNAYAIKLTRDAELYLEDEFSGDLVQSIRKSLKKRETGLPCRFLYDLHAPYPLIGRLRERLGLAEEDLVAGGRYHNLHDLCDFPRFGIAELSYPPLPPLPHPVLESAPSMLEAIAERDHLLHFPYQRFDYVLRLLDEAAADPDVEEIWITLYRTAKNSQVAQSLIAAAHAGKKVTAFIEVKARFDEESNLATAEKLERAGVRTLYSMPGLKVHAKLLLITRRRESGAQHFAYLATGNFNEKTARVYTDHALLTADPRLTKDVRRVFNFLSGSTREPTFEHLIVAPFQLRKRVYKLIEREAEAAAAGKPAGIVMKMNSLEDERVIRRLYDAARAGVDIRAIIRGICCLIPGAPGQSERITVRSIVDRFLEHGRIYRFENGGDPQYYLASADWMTRNLSRRVEVMFPVYDPALRAELHTVLDIQFADNQRARILDAEQSNRLLREPDRPPVRAQIEVYRFLRTRLGESMPAPSRREPTVDHVNPAHA